MSIIYFYQKQLRLDNCYCKETFRWAKYDKKFFISFCGEFGGVSFVSRAHQ